MNTAQIKMLIPHMTPAERREIERMLSPHPLWNPQPGPQSMAFFCEADELFYGGQAGGGKTDLVLGLAITAHRKSIIFRREYKQLTGADGLIQRSMDILEDKTRFNGHELVWRGIPGGRMLEFGAVQYEKDKNKYKGRAHDLKGFDELPEFTESQYRFLIGWARSTDTNQRVRVVGTGNPPTSQEGYWVKEHWGAWLNENHSRPALPGELRWYTTIDGEEVELDSGESFDYDGEVITPRSRTFIPASLDDNDFLGPEYRSVLQGLPEPLRSQLLYGDFTVGFDDDPWQVIPSAWVHDAQERWERTPRPEMSMTALGVDVARGGNDQTVLSARYGNWFAPLDKHPGKDTPDGPAVAALVTQALGEERPVVNQDIIGVGSSPYDILTGQGFDVNAINFAVASTAKDKSGKLEFRNLRAEAFWRLREALDPATGDNIALPPDSELLADLTALRWKLTVSGIQIESKQDIKKRIGRSTDCGDAVALAALIVNVAGGPLPRQPEMESKFSGMGDELPEGRSRWKI